MKRGIMATKEHVQEVEERFPDTLGDIEQLILDGLKDSKNGMSRIGIKYHVGRKGTRARIDQALSVLHGNGLAFPTPVRSRKSGRTIVVWRLRKGGWEPNDENS